VEQARRYPHRIEATPMLDGAQFFQFFPNDAPESDCAASNPKSPDQLRRAALLAALEALEIEFRSILQSKRFEQDRQSG